MRSLKVFCGGKFAGTIEERPEGFVFAYDASYLERHGEPISFTMPTSTHCYFSEFLFPCFTNLLPEGTNRRTICRLLHIDENDFFGMLISFAGRDFIGNLSFEK